MSEIRHAAHRLQGLGRFFVIDAALLLFFGVISPFLVSISPDLQLYGELQDLYEIHSGAFYYTDLKTQQEAQDAVRYAVRRSSSSKK
jgi:hypothetical protein